MYKYIGSVEHKENAKKSIKKGQKVLVNIVATRKELYYLNPKRCLSCSTPIDYKNKNRKTFCNNSCSAKYNNTGRILSDKHKERTSKTIKAKYATGELDSSFKSKAFSCKIIYSKCPVCTNIFIQKSFNIRKTCSNECRTELIFRARKYQNGKRKTILFNNKIQGEVLLESSWELIVAEKLEHLNIEWIRPKPIKWERNNKKHLYYPDFYLPKYDVYLDPKNPYCMVLDESKMNIISKKINIIYGPLNKIIDYITKLPSGCEFDPHLFDKKKSLNEKEI